MEEEHDAVVDGEDDYEVVVFLVEVDQEVDDAEVYDSDQQEEVKERQVFLVFILDDTFDALGFEQFVAVFFDDGSCKGLKKVYAIFVAFQDWDLEHGCFQHGCRLSENFCLIPEKFFLRFFPSRVVKNKRIKWIYPSENPLLFLYSRIFHPME